jgi:hypothetical protein
MLAAATTTAAARVCNLSTDGPEYGPEYDLLSDRLCAGSSVRAEEKKKQRRRGGGDLLVFGFFPFAANVFLTTSFPYKVYEAGCL